MEKEKPMMVVWDEKEGYNARQKSYPTNLGAPKFDLPEVDLSKTKNTKKMIDVFERERVELIEKAKQLQTEYMESVMVWESKYTFEPIVGNVYYLYDFGDGDILTIIKPEEWGRQKFFKGSFVLTSEYKWKRN
jgi:hypothetical protein